MAAEPVLAEGLTEGQSRPASATSANLGQPPTRCFLATFACWWSLFAGIGALWALATPIGASPDAPSQVARAASVVRGQWVGPAVPGPGSAVTTYVWVPETYLGPGATCYMFKEDVNAACAPAVIESARVVRTTSHVGRYLPAYYLAVGWPSLLTSSVAGIYLMQMASVVLGSAFLALAVATARKWSNSPLLVPAIAVAATPMTLFLTSSVNPNGLEIDAAIAVWAAAVVLVGLRSPPKGLLAVLAISTAAMVWMRPSALVWPFIVAAVLAPQAWGRLGTSLLARRDVRAWCGIVTVAGLGALAWTVLAGAASVLKSKVTYPRSASLLHLVAVMTGYIPSLLHQAVGDFGWLDTPVPLFTLVIWAVLVTAMLAAGLLFARGKQGRRLAMSVVLALLASFVVPVATLVAAAPTYGYIGQGRYFLALWVGLPIVAAGFVRPARSLERARRAAHRFAGTVAILVASAQFLAFYWALRRYIVGIPGPLTWHAGARSQWQPPLPGWWLIGLFLILCSMYGLAVARQNEPSSAVGSDRLVLSPMRAWRNWQTRQV